MTTTSSNGSTLPAWNVLTHQERCDEAVRLSEAVEHTLGIKRTLQNNSEHDTAMGAKFGVSRTTWWRYRHGQLPATSKRLPRYTTVRHKMHALCVEDAKLPTTPSLLGTGVITRLDDLYGRVQELEGADAAVRLRQQQEAIVKINRSITNTRSWCGKMDHKIDKFDLTPIYDAISKQMHGCSGDDMIGLNTMMVDLDKRLGKAIRALSAVEDRLDLEIEAVTKRLLEIDLESIAVNKPWWRFWR